jgi:hypothetical protein
MTYYPGKKSYVGLKKQAVAGTAETVPAIFLPVEDFPDIKSSAPNYYSKEFRAVHAEINKVYRKPNMSSGGSISIAAYNNFVSYALYGVFGAVASSGDDEGYTHAYTVDDDALPIWTIFTGTADLPMEKFHDMTMKNISFSAGAGENVMVGVEVEGASGDIITAAATPTYTTLRPINYADVSVSLGGSANCDIDAFDIQIDRGVQVQRTMCTTGLGAWEPNKVYPTTIDCSGSFTMYFPSFDEYKFWLGKSDATSMKTDTFDDTDADRALVITMTGEEIKAAGAATRDTITITVPKIVYDDANIERTYDDVLKVTFNFKAVHDAATETSVAGTGTVAATVISEVADPDA